MKYYIVICVVLFFLGNIDKVLHLYHEKEYRLSKESMITNIVLGIILICAGVFLLF